MARTGTSQFSMQAAISTVDWKKEVLRARDIVASQGDQPCSTSCPCPHGHSAMDEPLLPDGNPGQGQESQRLKETDDGISNGNM